MASVPAQPARSSHSQTSHSNSVTTQHSNSTPQQSAPIPVPRTNSRPVRRIEFAIPDPFLTDSDSIPVPELEPMHLNCFEDEFVTEGTINGIPTSIVFDSGARISFIFTDFVDSSICPVSYKTILGISQVPKSVPINELPVTFPTLDGICRLAVDSRLPTKTAIVATP